MKSKITKEFLENFIESMQDGFSVLDVNGVHIDVNPAFCRMTGYARDELIGTGPPYPYWPPEFMEDFKGAFEKTLKGDFESFELTFMRKNGERFPVIVSPSWIKDEQGEIVNYFATVKDMTERKLAEEKLFNARQNWENIFQAIGHITFILDPQFNIIKANRAAVEATEKSVDELLGRKCYEIFHDATRPPDGCPMQKVLISGEMESNDMEVELLGRTFLVSCTPVFDTENHLQNVIHIATDITERRRAEEEIKMLSSVVEQSTEGMAITDLDDNLIFINEAWCKMHGYTSCKELLGKNLAIFHNKEQLENEVNPFIKKLIQFGAYSGEMGHVTKDGKPFPTIMTSIILKDKQGKPYSMAASIKNITEQKLSEKLLYEKEERYRELFNNINAGVAVYEAVNNGKDFVFRDFNKAGQRIEKLKKEQVIGKKVSQIFPAIKDFGLFEVFQRVWKTGKPEHHPVTLYKDDRTSGWRENYVYKLPTGEIVAVYEDATERKQAEAEIQKLAKFPSENPMPVLRINKEGILLYANHASDILLNEWIFSIDEPVQDVWRKIVREILISGRQKEVEIVIDNRVFSFNFAPVVGDGYVNIYGYDITERRQMLEALRKSEAQLSNAMKIANLGHWELDVASGVFTFSDNFYAIFRTNAKAMGGYRMSIADYAERFVHPDDAPLVAEETRKAVETDDPNFSRYLEHRMLYADGSVGHMAVRFFIVKDDEGETIKTYGVNQDITERKLAEEQIKKSLKEKEILLRELYHRTKNNMQVISSMLRLKARTINEPQISETFQEIENKILSMALVHQKLYESEDLSHINLKNYIGDLISLIQKSYRELMNNITIRARMKAIHVMIDTAIPMGLVINELLTNAVKHAFPDGRRGVIHVNLNATSRRGLVLEISDNGIGLRKNFDLEKDSHLGLQTVLALAEDQLEGEVNFTSRNGLHCRLTFGKELYQPRV